jgi:hypothetical protein
MSSVVISGDTSGAITLSAPAVAGTNTATLPAATGTVMVSGNMPAFSAYASSVTSSTNATWTLLGYQTENFDTASCYNNTGSTVGSIPAYSFLPNVAGYYQVSASHNMAGAPGTNNTIGIWKNNGTWMASGSTVPAASATGYWTVSGLIYLNGTSDYVNIQIYQNGGTQNTGTNSNLIFTAALVRSA